MAVCGAAARPWLALGALGALGGPASGRAAGRVRPYALQGLRGLSVQRSSTEGAAAGAPWAASASSKPSAAPRVLTTGASVKGAKGTRFGTSKWRTPAVQPAPLLEEGTGRALIKLRRGGFAPLMKEVQVTRTNIPSSVKKLNRLAWLVRGRTVSDALFQMRFAKQLRSNEFMALIIEGVNRAEKQFGLAQEQLRVAICTVNRGSFLKRLDIKGRGRTGMIKRPASHLTVVLRQRDPEAEAQPWLPAGQRKRGFSAKLRRWKQTERKPLVPVLPEPAVTAEPTSRKPTRAERAAA